ncbi:MAG: peptidylprolyl isomerase [Planctomycetota bacterium]
MAQDFGKAFRAAASLVCLAVLAAASCSKAREAPPAEPAASPAKKAAAYKIPPSAATVGGRRVTGAYIVLSHVEAPRKQPATTRSRAQALELAKETHRRVTSGEDFETVAKGVSEAPDARETGGRLAVVPEGVISPAYKEIVEPLFRMEVGQVSEVLDTPIGYVIAKRLPVEERAVAHVWIAYKGAEGARPAVTRTKEEARALAEKVLEEARRPGADFSELVKKYSDDHERLKEAGGFMGGVFTKADLRGGREALGQAMFSLEVGGISDVVESPYGYHVLKRVRLEDCCVWAKQIVVQYKGARGAGRNLTRTKEEALKLAESLLEKIRGGANFEELAVEHSDHYSGKQAKGYVGPIMKGLHPKPLEEAAFSLEVGDVSEVVETEQGFHILWRLE